MRTASYDRTTIIATAFIRDASARMHGQTREAIDCLASASWLGVRQNLTSLRGEAERVARVECHLSHRAASHRLRTQVKAALTALDAAAMRPLGDALAQILQLTRGARRHSRAAVARTTKRGH